MTTSKTKKFYFSVPTFLLQEESFEGSNVPVNNNSASDLLNTCTKVVAELGAIIKSVQPDLLTPVIIIQQQLNLIRASVLSTTFSGSPLLPVTPPLTPTPRLNSDSINLPSTSVAAILARPQPFVRSQKRRIFKKKNHGVMTSDEITAQYEKDEEEKENAAAKKEQNKQIREQKRVQNLTLRNIKKEKDDQKKRINEQALVTSAAKRVRR